MCANLRNLIIGSARSNRVTTATVNFTNKNLSFQKLHMSYVQSFTHSHEDVNSLEVKEKKMYQWYKHAISKKNYKAAKPRSRNNKTQTYSKKRKGNNPLYVESPEAANTIATFISKDLLKNASFVAEVNPGNGFLTTELLAAGVPCIHLFEENELFHERLTNLSKQFPNRIDLRPYNLFKLVKYIYVDFLFDRKNTEKVLLGIEEEKWENKSSVQIIGGIQDHKFLCYIMQSIVNQTDIISYGRPLMYLTIPTRIWKTYASRKQKPTTAKVILFHTLFDCTHYGSISEKGFSIVNSKLRQKSGDDAKIHIVKIEPKPDLFTNYISKEDLPLFWQFVRHIMAKKSRKIIPELEKFVPGCGMKLIEQDYNMFMQFNDLIATEFLTLFKVLKSLNKNTDTSPFSLLEVDSVVSDINSFDDY